MLTKEECLKAIDYMCYKCKEAHYDCDLLCDRFNIFKQLINEHFELKEKYITLECDYSDFKEVFNLKVKLLREENAKLEKALVNPSLKFEELKDDMVVWDNKEECLIEIHYIPWNDSWYYYYFGIEVCEDFKFEENRFYRYEVQE